VAALFNVERLRTLHAVWKYGSLSAAAQRLHVTPSAVSQQLTKLEREAQAELLVPHGRGVRLTTAGDLLARRADRILAELRAARQDLDSLGGEVIGPVQVGAIPSGVHTFITTALTDLVTRHPGVEPLLAEVEPEQGLPMLSEGLLDFAVVESWENMPLTRPAGTVWTPLLDDTACVVLPRGHPHGEATSVSVDDLTDELWVAWGQNSRANAWMRQTLRERDLEPTVRYTVTGYSTQFAVVAGLRAVALVPTMAATVAPSTVRAVPLRPPLRRTLHAVQALGEPRPAVVACLTALGRAARTWRPAQD